MHFFYNLLYGTGFVGPEIALEEAWIYQYLTCVSLSVFNLMIFLWITFCIIPVFLDEKAKVG